MVWCHKKAMSYISTEHSSESPLVYLNAHQIISIRQFKLVLTSEFVWCLHRGLLIVIDVWMNSRNNLKNNFDSSNFYEKSSWRAKCFTIKLTVMTIYNIKHTIFVGNQLMVETILSLGKLKPFPSRKKKHFLSITR